MRLATTHPAGTDIVRALGASEALVAISHLCDGPDALPRLTCPSSDGLRHEVDPAVLASVAPDVIITQGLCTACGVTTADLEATGTSARLVALSPRRLGDVWDDVERVGAAFELGMLATAIAAGLRGRVEAVEAAVAGRPRPRVLALEWLAPAMVAGLWVPELIAAAGGEAVGAAAGDEGRPVSVDELRAMQADVVVVMACGLDLPATRLAMAETPVDVGIPVWRVDGAAGFNRPGPRLAESVEQLAALLHPEAVPHLVHRHAGRFERA